MTLKFSYTSWAAILSHLLGGFETAGYIHRTAAVFMIGLFVAHVVDLLRRVRTEFGSVKAMLSGPNTMLPNRKDVRDAVGSFKWFLGRGPRPQYGRWTYWEKFDYFAVFWGMFVIGSTGMMLWFPEFFTLVVPGWIINVATIIHSDEALLAVGFIFTVHFFNTHLRPEKFPMDTSIFTGHVPLAELNGMKVCAFAGIGSPEAFRRGLTALGAKIVSFRAFPDHHPYCTSDLESLRRLSAEDLNGLKRLTHSLNARLQPE